MKRKLIVLMAVAVTLVFSITPALAKGGKRGPAGNSNIAHIIFESDEYSPVACETVQEDAWGKMKYNVCGDELCYVVNFHDLEPGCYALVSGGNVIAFGQTVGNGQLHLSECYDGELGAKFNLWLVEEDCEDFYPEDFDNQNPDFCRVLRTQNHVFGSALCD